MRLNKFINEISDSDRFIVERFIEDIKKNCKPYLKLLKGRSPLIRGMNHAVPTDIGSKPVRKDRKSKMGHSKETMKDIDDYMDHIHGARRTESVIAISQFSNTMRVMFGDPYWIFPIGGFTYTFVEAQDFNYGDSDWSARNFMNYIKDRRWEDPDMDDYGYDGINHPGIIVNKDFDRAYNKGWEIWFECDRYYYIQLSSPVAVVLGNQMKYMRPNI